MPMTDDAKLDLFRVFEQGRRDGWLPLDVSRQLSVELVEPIARGVAEVLAQELEDAARLYEQAAAKHPPESESEQRCRTRAHVCWQSAKVAREKFGATPPEN